LSSKKKSLSGENSREEHFSAENFSGENFSDGNFSGEKLSEDNSKDIADDSDNNMSSDTVIVCKKEVNVKNPDSSDSKNPVSKNPDSKQSSNSDSTVLKETSSDNLQKNKPPTNPTLKSKVMTPKYNYSGKFGNNSSSKFSSSKHASASKPASARPPSRPSSTKSSNTTSNLPENYRKPNNTPHSAFRSLNNPRPGTTPSRIRFNIAESLKKKPSWKMHTGKLKPLGSYTPDARMSVERSKKVEDGRLVERREALEKFKRKTVVFEKAREGFLQKAHPSKPEINKPDSSNLESTDNNIPELKITS